MKIAIISEFCYNTVNYGNYLQTYALNASLRRQYSDAVVDTICYTDVIRKRRTSFSLKKGIEKIQNSIAKMSGRVQVKTVTLPQNRQKAFLEFAKQNIYISNQNWKSFRDSNYDIYIVGSDVVWQQHSPYWIDRLKFLDFHPKKPAKKIAYAASFGTDWIPRSNQKPIRQCLKRFADISVREKSSIELLASIGIQNAQHALDPTLLLEKEEWMEIEQMPEGFVAQQYAFVYLLGESREQRSEIQELCRKNSLKIVTIPQANGLPHKADEGFGEYHMDACSPQEWIWLVHHAKLVITDSFHGIVFSTIFQRPFFAMRREMDMDINNRLVDYLDTIGQKDKQVSTLDGLVLDETYWDYEDIQKRIEEKKEHSRRFLYKTLLK